jgi:hypothetical protein
LNPALFDQEATLIKRAPAERGGRYNNAVLTADPEAERPIAGYLEASILQTGSRELTVGEQTTVTSYRWYCAADEPIDSSDQLVIDGQTYEVTTKPTAPHVPWTEPDHLEVDLRLIE